MIVTGIASQASIDQEATFIGVSVLRWDNDALPPLWLGHDATKPAGKILKLEYENRDLMCVADIDTTSPHVRAFLREHRDFGFSIGAKQVRYIQVGPIVVLVEAELTEISLTDHPANAACKVTVSYGGWGPDWDALWAEMACRPKPAPLNLPPIRYPDKEQAR